MGKSRVQRDDEFRKQQAAELRSKEFFGRDDAKIARNREVSDLRDKRQHELSIQELQNKGALDPVKYRQNAGTARFDKQLGFDKSKYQQDFGEGQRVGDRQFGFDVQKQDDNFWQEQQRFKQSKLDQDRRHEFDVFKTKYKNKADKKAAWDSQIDQMVNVQLDKDGVAIPGTGGRSYQEAAQIMKHRERFYNENMAPGSKNTDDVTESQDPNGIKSYTNVGAADQDGAAPRRTGLANYEEQAPEQSRATSAFEGVGSALKNWNSGRAAASEAIGDNAFTSGVKGTFGSLRDQIRANLRQNYR